MSDFFSWQWISAGLTSVFAGAVVGLVLLGYFLASLTLMACQYAIDPYGDNDRRRPGRPLLSGWQRRLVLISRLIIGVMVLIHVPEVTIYYAAINPRPLLEDPLPVPNGYEDLIHDSRPLSRNATLIHLPVLNTHRPACANRTSCGFSR